MNPAQPVPESASQIALPWIVRLRYGMAVGQAWALGVAYFALRIDLPIRWMALGPVLLVASNLLLAKRAGRGGIAAGITTSTLVGWVFAFDAVCLTGLLMLSGGPSNPFNLLYLVHITLAAGILNKRQTWLLVGLSTLCFALLFRIYRAVPQLESHYRDGESDLYLTGMWISFTLAMLVVAMYAARISRLLRAHEAKLLEIQEELAKKDRLASLVTLAAGAAHELNTPLGTIAIVAKELERSAKDSPLDHAIAEDSRLIRKEVDRCREILQQMSADGAEPAGHAVETIKVRELLDGVSRAVASDRLRIQLPEGAILPPLTIPVHAVIQALVALVKNAIDASGPASAVHISVRPADGVIRFVVTDRGTGIPAEVMRRVGEPFFTTKEPGKGMGLGTFLARTLAERLGGRLTFQSAEGVGTSAILELPAAVQQQPVRGNGVPV